MLTFFRCSQSEGKSDIECLLDPADESTIIDGATDAEIYYPEAVMDLQNAQEQPEAPINGGDDDADDISPVPTCREVFAAVSLVKYIDLEPDPLARKLDALLDSFKYNLHIEQTESSKPTHYFSRTTS